MRLDLVAHLGLVDTAAVANCVLVGAGLCNGTGSRTRLGMGRDRCQRQAADQEANDCFLPVMHYVDCLMNRKPLPYTTTSTPPSTNDGWLILTPMTPS